jgi:hypothetical protein
MGFAMQELLITMTLLLFPFVIPMYTVWTHPNWKGVLLSAFVLWIFMTLAEVFLIGHYGTGGPAGLGLVIWIVLGLPFSAVFCMIFLGLCRFIKKNFESQAVR